jgi:hypothetical protein
MTRKHFNAIANAIREQIEKPSVDDSIRCGIMRTAEALADEFEVFNSNFNRDYFLAVAFGETE